MQFSQINHPKKLNLDKHHGYLLPDESFYLLNNETDELLGKNTPLPANLPLCEMELPAGENYNVGRMNDGIVNEEYSWTYNTNGANFISRIKDDGECEIVYYGECLKVSPNPESEIVKFRNVLHINRLCHKVPDGILKQLIWVDGVSDGIFCLDVEASINTENFSTPFFDLCRDDCAYISLCVPQPQQCIHAEFVQITPEDGNTPNYLFGAFKFMYRFEYYDGRRSEWSDRSSLYFQDIKTCFDSTEGQSRCLKFNLPIGNPMVAKIHIGVSEDGGYSYSLYDTVEKYRAYSGSEYWYERQLNEVLNIDEDNCSFEYIFCNDRQRTPISPTEISREFNPMPRKVQGIVSMPKGALGFYNYEKGICPIDKASIDKIKINIDCENVEKSCSEDIVEVKVRAIIYNFYQGARNGYGNWFVYKIGDDIAKFGKPHADGDGATIYDQYFRDDKEGFPLYIEGTDLQVVTKQWQSSPKMGSTKEVGAITVIKPSSALISTTDTGIKERRQAAFFYQEASFYVKKGTKGFIRAASHKNSNALGGNQNTSTQVKGTFDIKQYTGNENLPDYKDADYDIYFDTCNVANGVLDLSEAFVIEDLYTKGSGKQSSAYNGYIYDIEGLPVEGARIWANSVQQTTTDHNGFYSFYIFDGTSSPVTIDVVAEVDCATSFTFMSVGQFSSVSGELQVSYVDYNVILPSYENKKQKVRVQVTDCDGKPVSGIRVAISGSKYKVSEADGFANFSLRNYYGRNRIVTAILMDKGGCILTDCSGNCDPCMPSSTPKLLPLCFDNLTSITLLGTPFVINTESISIKKGLKSGGRYPFAIVAEGECGRSSAAYELKYLDVPTTQSKGALGFCGLGFDVLGKLNLPDWVTRLIIVRGENINKLILQWVVDKVERTANGFIKLTLQSLNDYNAGYNFKTNTVYKYAEGDRIEFIKNGDGKLFSQSLNYQIQSPYNDTVISGVEDSPADFFNQILLRDASGLSNLKEGAVIEVKRQQPLTDKPVFFGICASIPVVDGEPMATSGSFETFDTYLVSRQIGKYPSQKFEHFAPSDFYNYPIFDDRGKVFFKNEYENERRWGRNITVNNPNVINYFGDFEKTFDIAEQGDIIAVNIKDEKIGLCISQKDNFIFSVSDDLLRMGANNVVVASSPDQIISRPEAKLRGAYGCNYQDIGSVFFGDGYATWIDSNALDYIIHNYQEARPAGASRDQTGINGTCSTHFRNRIQKKNFLNAFATGADEYRFATGINGTKNHVYLTLKRLSGAGINNDKEVIELTNETIIFDPENNEYKGFASFTPEGYSELKLNTDEGCSFITYQNAVPYVHPVHPEKWNEFYGVACDWVIGVSLNKGLEKVKMPIALELKSDTMWYVWKAYGEKYLSEIPPVKMKEMAEGKWNAGFLKNINTKGGLYQGKSGVGYVFNIIFVRDNTVDLKVNTRNEGKMTSFSEIGDILFKFSIVEQSGFTGNL